MKSDATTEGTPSGRAERALGTAYRYLDKRERTTTEVARHLRREGCDPETVEQTLVNLREGGRLDDHRFARLFTEDKRELEQWGTERIARALVERGVDSETVAAVLNAAHDPQEDASQAEHERALALLRRRFPEPPHTRRDRDRALGVLLRKGYEADLALEILSAYARE